MIDKLQSMKKEIKYDNLHGVIGYQPQKNGIDPELTVHQHLILFAKISGIERDRID